MLILYLRYISPNGLKGIERVVDKTVVEHKPD